jgi:predicted secreted protein
VCAFYIAKIKGMDQETQEFIEKLKRFYKYDDIVGIEELMNL